MSRQPRRNVRLRVRRGGRGPSAIRLTALVLFTLALVVSLTSGSGVKAQEGEGAVYVVPVTGTIDLGLAPYLRRTIAEANERDAAAVLIEIDTPGGRLDAVLQMRDAILDSEVRTIAFVNRTAFSAGALVAIAAEEIYMTPGAVMGAATPIEGATGETASEKVVSAVRSTFRTTAEVRGRDPRVAEAMVDPEVEVPDLVERGKLLTLTTTEAQAWGYADGIAATRTELLAATGLSDAPLIETAPSLAEDVVRLITDPVVASLLITLGILLLIGDFLTEGLGIPALVGAGLLAVFFWGHTLAGLAGWEDIALVALGVALLAVELLVIPGFGVPGILGLIALFGGFFLAMLSRDIRTPEQMERAAIAVSVAFVAVVAGFFLILALLPQARVLRGLVLESSVTGGGVPTRARRPAGWVRWFGGAATLGRPETPTPPSGTEPSPRSLTGATGTALSDLRPSGIAEIEGRRIDVVTEGDYIRAGELIEVIRDEGYRRLVRRVAR